MRLIITLSLLLLSAGAFSLQTGPLPAEVYSGHTNRNANTYFNLGLVSLSSNAPGAALLNFKRATILNPGDREARELLDGLRKKAGTPPFLFDFSPVEKAALFPFRIFSRNGAAVFGLLLALLGAAGLTLMFTGHFSRIPLPAVIRNWKFSVIFPVMLGLGWVYALSAFIRHQAAFDPRQAVAVTAVTLTETPESLSLPLGELPEGAECVIEASSDGYWRVLTIEGKSGWAPTNAVWRVWSK